MTDVPIFQVTPAGGVVPAYADVLAALQDKARSIYGSDIYIDPDSQDGQFLAVFAQVVSDLNNTSNQVFLGYSPSTAQGVALSSQVKINGLKRLQSSASTAPVEVIGVAGTTLNNAVIGDDLGLNTSWSIPNGTLIPPGGLIIVTATCTQQGDVRVASGHLTKIRTPINGWQTVTSTADSTPGAPVEDDATLRKRQAVSTALPALTPVPAIEAAIGNVPGVTRQRVYENDTNVVDSDELPQHSISAVVEGGDAMAVATAIAIKKTPGTTTYGNIPETVFDSRGVPNTINFFDLALVVISVTVNLRALPGFVSTTATAIKQSVAAFVSGLDIGEISYQQRLNAPADLSGDAATTATGQTQTVLDGLSRTYQVASIVQSRVANIATTTAVAGPYLAGVTTITVADSSELYLGANIQITLDNATLLTTKINGIAGEDISFANAIPALRSVLTGGGVFLTDDVQIAFNEAASCDALTNVTVNVA